MKDQQRKKERRGIKVVFVRCISLQGACVERKDRADLISWQKVNELRRDIGAVCVFGE